MRKIYTGDVIMFKMRHATQEDKLFWFTLDRHIKEAIYEIKIRDKQAYIILDGNKPIGVLRYSLFWDSIPFVNLIELQEAYHGKGFGTHAMKYWENDMQGLGHKLVMTSTQSNEQAQHFYRKLGYVDSGCLLLYKEPAEIFFVKSV